MGALTRDVWKPRSLPLGTEDMVPTRVCFASLLRAFLVMNTTVKGGLGGWPVVGK